MTDYTDKVARYLEKKTDKLKKVSDELMEDEEFEVLDLTDRGWVERVFKDLSKASVAKQLTVGGVTGWGAGYLAGKVGKAAAAAVGGSLLLLQIAHYQGYITVNWGKMEKSLHKAQRRWETRTRTNTEAITREVKEFVIENAFVAGGFTAGFLLGLAS